MRNRLLVLLTLSVLVFAALACGLLAAPLQSTSRTNVWRSVYSKAQAERGKVEYDKTCAKCHAGNFDGIQNAEILGDFGPRFSIRGTDFMSRWREDTVYSLFNLIKVGMPPRTEPGVTAKQLSDQEALDLTAYILQGNEFPAGNQDMTIDELRGIRIQERDGPKPLPSFSMVQVVGCLKQLKPGIWELAQASPPTRVRELGEPTPEEMAASAAEPAGELEFDLQSIGYVGKDFIPSDHELHKMQVRGVLIRQPPSIRIDVRTFVEVAQECEP